jgi:hypothetical protein
LVLFSIDRALLPRFRRTEPDLNLTKQVEQVTTLVVARRLARIRSYRNHGGGSDPRISNLAIIGWADISLQKQPNQPEAAEGDRFAKGQSGTALAPPDGSMSRATLAAEPLLCQIR